MTSQPQQLTKSQRRQAQAAAVAKAADAKRRRRSLRIALAWVAVAAIVVAGLYWVFSSRNASSSTTTTGGSGYKHAVGQPGPGQDAADFTLPSTEGGTVTLSELRGQTVLLYFQEGLMCQPCFDQITDLEKSAAALRDAGIDRVLSISVDPQQQLAQKGEDMGLTTPLLSDPDLNVIETYDANSYGMMGDSHAGHSFLLVNPEGEITWRADYGGAPDYTMFVPTEDLLKDLKTERIS